MAMKRAFLSGTAGFLGVIAFCLEFVAILQIGAVLTVASKLKTIDGPQYHVEYFFVQDLSIFFTILVSVISFALALPRTSRPKSYSSINKFLKMKWLYAFFTIITCSLIINSMSLSSSYTEYIVWKTDECPLLPWSTKADLSVCDKCYNSCSMYSKNVAGAVFAIVNAIIASFICVRLSSKIGTVQNSTYASLE